MRQVSIFLTALVAATFSYGQDKPNPQLEVHLQTVGEVTFQGNGRQDEAGITAEDQQKTKESLTQWKGPTGIKIMTNPKSNGQELTPLIFYVPNTYDLAFEVVAGNITLKNLARNIAGTLQRGNLQISGLGTTQTTASSVRLRTQAGNINIEKSQINGSIITQAGDINLTDVQGQFSLLTAKGRIAAAFTSGFFEGQKEPFSFGLPAGDIKATGARAGLQLEVSRGNILIQKSLQLIMATASQQGDIRLEGVAGQIRALTAKGSVWAELLPEVAKQNQPIWLEVNEGDLTVALPKEWAGVLVIDASQTRDFEKPFVIESTLKTDLLVYEDQKAPKGERVARTLRSRQVLGESKSSIVLKVRNGNLSIKTY